VADEYIAEKRQLELFVEREALTMIHLSYEQEITLTERLLMAQGVSADDAADRKTTNAIFFISLVSFERLLSYRAVSYHILVPWRSTAILIFYLDFVS